MVLGLSEATFTVVHVILSLVGVASGVTGFLFPRDHLMPSHIVGIISLILLAIAIVALYRYRLGRAWRWIYVICAVLALYLNVFVGVVQA